MAAYVVVLVMYDRDPSSFSLLNNNNKMNSNSSSHERPSCPCKRLPLVLSSFTAAEHGQVQALMMRHNNNNGSDKNKTTTTTTTPLAERQDAYGNTPLHLAAQHGHVAATAMLLHVANCRVNAQASGATPLHRAAFSGAVATMQLLINHKGIGGEEDAEQCSLLVQDSSFGDMQTPLHKAASGGRYLAIQLLIDAHKSRQSLPQALKAVDAAGRTPLQVAMEKNNSNNSSADANVERQSVARWDAVAGHTVADWEKCIQLLQQAQNECRHDDDDFESNISNSNNADTLGNHKRNIIPAKQQFPYVPLPSLSSLRDCLDCTATEDGGRCLTRSWETQFWSALSQSTEQQLSKKTNPVMDHDDSLNRKNEKNIDNSNKISTDPEENIVVDKKSSATQNKYNDDNDIMSNENNKNDTNNQVAATGSSNSTFPSSPSSSSSSQASSSSSLGRLCSSCQTQTFALYPCTGGLLVCKKCQRRQRKGGRRLG
jgi:ankyrin repeat protein